MIEIFLSASVPLPDRNRKFYDTADVFLIREAIRALIEVILPIGRITFGGHPAITPLISLYVEHSRLERDRLTIFQSAFFQGQMPVENDEFFDVKIIPAIRNNLQLSILAMRKAMITSKKFHAAVLIGGMEGIKAEETLFRKYNPGAIVLPVPATGAAARMVFNEGNYAPELENEISFASMFRRKLLPAP
ncbi:hypothetical protein ACIOYV_07930 [Pseudomonas sp. NPDC087342]|uniref:SLOG domain-containing protein n=1 Tax=Pseudomonas sp. NPDC087342 TaxID=3364437 RepID=UPI0037FFC36A